MELPIEFVEHRYPSKFTGGNIIQFVLGLGGKVIVYDISEVLYQKVGDDLCQSGRYQLIIVGANSHIVLIFSDFTSPQNKFTNLSYFAFDIFLLDVLTILDSTYGRRISAGPADT